MVGVPEDLGWKSTVSIVSVREVHAHRQPILGEMIQVLRTSSYDLSFAAVVLRMESFADAFIAIHK